MKVEDCWAPRFQAPLLFPSILHLSLLIPTQSDAFSPWPGPQDCGEDRQPCLDSSHRQKLPPLPIRQWDEMGGTWMKGQGAGAVKLKRRAVWAQRKG
eukprot:1020180-Rhodomonas_salina.2